VKRKKITWTRTANLSGILLPTEEEGDPSENAGGVGEAALHATPLRQLPVTLYH